MTGGPGTYPKISQPQTVMWMICWQREGPKRGRGVAVGHPYTVEAVQDDLRHLRPGGVLAITRWVALPPRDVLKLFGAAVLALQRSGVTDPASQLALMRSWKTSTLLVKNGAFGSEDIAAIKVFCVARSFDVYPGMKPQEANRYNVVTPPDLFDSATALLGPGRDEFVQNYKFDIAPATDDQPHFFHFFKWRSLPELLSLKEQGGLPLLEWGYPVLVATLAQAALASLLLIAAPAAWSHGSALGRTTRCRAPGRAAACSSIFWQSDLPSCSSRSRSSRSSCCF